MEVLPFMFASPRISNDSDAGLPSERVGSRAVIRVRVVDGDADTPGGKEERVSRPALLHLGERSTTIMTERPAPGRWSGGANGAATTSAIAAMRVTWLAVLARDAPVALGFGEAAVSPCRSVLMRSPI